MNQGLKVEKEMQFLLLEDEPTDAAIVEEALREAGFRFVAQRVETRDQFAAALQAFPPDLILADFSLPSFDAHDALKVARQLAPDVPVIIVTGALPDERAVELLTEGARDYVLKDRLSRLGPAVRRALADARAEAVLARNERYFRKLIEDGADAFFVLDAQGKLIYRSPSGMQLTGWPADEVMGRNVVDFIYPDDVPLAQQAIAGTLTNPDSLSHVELRMLHRDGSVRHAEAFGKNLLDDPDVGGIVVTVRDISQRKAAEVTLQRAVRALRTLSACNEQLVRANSERELLDAVCRIIVDIGNYALAWVGYPQQDADQTMGVAAQYGDKSGYLRTVRISWGDNPFGHGPSGKALRSGSAQVNQDFEVNPAMTLWRDAANGAGLRSSIALPLRNAAGPFAVLTIYASEPNAFYPEEISLLENLAEDLSYGITTLRTRDERDRIADEHRLDEDRLRASLEQAVTAISDTLEMRDEYTAGHQRRVRELSIAIARELQLSEDAIHGIGLAASIHDVGKIKVPSEILAKPGKLSNIEFTLIKEHAQGGYDILKSIQFPWPIATMVWQHHERMDGSGYPRGLTGEQILRESRILAVADVVEAMASYRPYRPALGVDIALSEIVRGRGTVYDSEVVDVCLKLFAEKRFAFSA